MSRLSDVFETIRTAVAGSSTLSSLVQATFGAGASLQVVIGADPADPPDLGDNPLVCVTSGGRSRDLRFARRGHGLTVWPAFRFDQRQDGRKWTPEEALDVIDQLCNAVDDAICPALQAANFAILPTGDGPDDSIQFPMVRAFLAYRVEIPARLP